MILVTISLVVLIGMAFSLILGNFFLKASQITVSSPTELVA